MKIKENPLPELLYQLQDLHRKIRVCQYVSSAAQWPYNNSTRLAMIAGQLETLKIQYLLCADEYFCKIDTIRILELNDIPHTIIDNKIHL